MTSRAILLGLVLAAGCRGSKHEHDQTKPTAPPPAETAALCADLEALASTAAGNFEGHRTETTVTRPGYQGVALDHDVTGTQHCAVVHPDPAYREEMVECELGEGGTMDAAQAVLAAWTPRIAGCAVVASWFSKPKSDGGHAWELEEDNHLLEIQLHYEGEEPDVRPVLKIQRPEI